MSNARPRRASSGTSGASGTSRNAGRSSGPAQSPAPKNLKSPQHVGRGARSLVSRTPVWARAIVVTLLTLLAAFTCVGTLYAASISRMYTDGQKVLSSAESLANSALGCGSDVSLGDAAHNLVTATNALNEELSGPQWDFFRDHTRFSGDITAAREMLASVDTLVNGPFTDLLNLSKRLQGFSMKNGSVDVSALMDMPDIVAQTHTDLKEQIAKLNKVETPSVAKVAAMLNAEKAMLQTVDSMLSEYDALINLLPQLLGEDGERTYLILVQNPAELRSAGGMVGTIAAVTADKGKVTIGDFASTINWDIPDEPLDDTVYQERDVFGKTFDQYPATTTIDPEFQRVAQLNKYMWLNQKGNADKNVAGVIALDPVFLQSLLGATGSVTLTDGRVLDGTTTVPFLLSDLYIDHPDFTDQNNYVSEAAQSIMNHVLGHTNASTASGLLKAVRDTSANGHFKLWMADEAEQDALISTGIIDDKSSGELSDDDTVPQAGIYLSELQMGKQDWYLRTATTVTKTCGDVLASQNALYTGAIDDRVSAAVNNTTLGQYTEDQLGDEYTVTFTMKNTLTETKVASLPEFVIGDENNPVPGGMKYRVVLTAPYGGEITAVQADVDTWHANTATLYDRQYVTFDQQWIAPGEELTIAYTVRVSSTASQPLDVVTTPIVNADGIETGSQGKVTDECPAESRSQSNGESGTTGESSGTSNGTDKSGTSTDSTDKSSSSSSDPSAGLDSLNELKSQVTCPVDIKSIASSV
ncbi:hypothetical protein CUU80_08550 [Bifidobacterium scaligerum]|uniref:DUF4012 domain-containing protein n=1 Tax=Bifidobacterium scaligerum TaxID=2052656 RepID=A0A2M9HP96_9BIFI|nr:hypothetical protein CUU80_08550 [Bifidobacterium scaligerum]